jgi:hypothetical protein
MSCCKKEPPKCVRRTKCKLKTIKDECRKPPEKKSCKCTLVFCKDRAWDNVNLTIYVNDIPTVQVESDSTTSYPFDICTCSDVRFEWIDLEMGEAISPWILKKNETQIASGGFNTEFNQKITC